MATGVKISELEEIAIVTGEEFIPLAINDTENKKVKTGVISSTAYKSAVKGGFEGTEEQFNKVMANPITFEVTGSI